MSAPRPYKGSEKYIFISYAHRDGKLVHSILERLQSEGYRFWFDEGIDPGNEWDETIATYINNCDYFIAFISENYLASNNCKDELNFARDLDKKRFLIYLEDVSLPIGMAMRLNRIQSIFYHKYQDLENFYATLFSADKFGEFKGAQNITPENSAAELGAAANQATETAPTATTAPVENPLTEAAVEETVQPIETVTPVESPTPAAAEPTADEKTAEVETFIKAVFEQVTSGNGAVPEKPKMDIPVVPEFVAPSPNPIVKSNIIPTGKVSNIVLEDGSVYSGEVCGKIPHGFGEITFTNGERYVGRFVNGKHHGRGSYTWTDGTRCEGDYADGKANGKGKKTFPRRNRFRRPLRKRQIYKIKKQTSSSRTDRTLKDKMPKKVNFCGLMC